MVGERIQDRLGREPVWRRKEDQLSRVPRNVRGKLNDLLADRLPRYENRNLGSGVLAGTAQAGIADILEDVIGVPFGAETEMVDINNNATRNGASGVEYTINVNSPTQTMAEARAFIESGTGYTSILTDLLHVEDVTLVKTRMLRDTYEVTVFVED